MNTARLDHATINTVDLAASVSFYGHYLGLNPGWRPAFEMDGAWLYPEDNSYPILHLIVRKDRTPAGGMFDHFAFRSRGLKAYLAKLKAAGEWHSATPVLGTKLVQVHHYDPNRVLIEVNFENEPFDPSDERPYEDARAKSTASACSAAGALSRIQSPSTSRANAESTARPSILTDHP